MSALVNSVDVEHEYPCIEFTTPTRTFERLFKDTSLKSLSGAVAKKLGLDSSSKLEFIQQRDNGKIYDLEDDDDFDAFRAYAFKKGFVNVRINVTEVTQKTTAPTTAPVANAAPIPSALAQRVDSAKLAVPSAVAGSDTPVVQNGAIVPTPIKKATKHKTLAAITSPEPAISETDVAGKTADAINSFSTPVEKFAPLLTDQESDVANRTKPKRARKKANETTNASTMPPPADETPRNHTVNVSAPSASDTDTAPDLVVKKAKKTTNPKVSNARSNNAEKADTRAAPGPQVPPVQFKTAQPEPSPASKAKHSPPNTVRFSEPVLSAIVHESTATASTNTGTELASVEAPPPAPEEPIKRKRGRPKKSQEVATVDEVPTVNAEGDPQAILAPTEQLKVSEKPEPKKRGPKPKKKEEVLTVEPQTEQNDASRGEASTPETGDAPLGDKPAPKKRGPKKKDVSTAEDIVLEQTENDTATTLATADPKAPQAKEDKPAPKKRGPKPKKKTGDVEMGNAATEPGAVEELTKDAKVKKRKKSEAVVTEEAEDDAVKKRKLTLEDTSSAQEADSNDPLLAHSSAEDVNSTASVRVKTYQSKAKRELTETERKQQDSALDEIMNRVKGRIAASVKADEAATKYPARLADRMEVDDDEDVEVEEPDSEEIITTKQDVSKGTAATATETPPTPPKKSFKSLKKDAMKCKRQKSVPAVSEDEEMVEEFLQPQPLTQRASTTSNSASTTEVEKTDTEPEDDEGASNEEDELRSDAVHTHITSPDIATMPSSRSDSEPSDSESEQESILRTRSSKVLVTSTPRPSMGSLPSLRNIAETSSKEIFSSPRDTPARYPLYPASQPVKGTKSEIVAETDPSSSSDSESNSDIGEDFSYIPKEKRAGATTDPGKNRGLRSALLQSIASRLPV